MTECEVVVPQDVSWVFMLGMRSGVAVVAKVPSGQLITCATAARR